MKSCFKCGAAKPLDQFYKHPMMADGHLNKCKDCSRLDVQRNRAARRDQYRAYDRSRADRKAEAIQNSKRRRPDRHRARVAVHNAVKRGRLLRKPCEVCGVTKVEAHHDDYSKPLEVRWLCRAHHAERHRGSTGERGVKDRYIQRSRRAGTLPAVA